jgi:hypothetical protein
VFACLVKCVCWSCKLCLLVLVMVSLWLVLFNIVWRCLVVVGVLFGVVWCCLVVGVWCCVVLFGVVCWLLFGVVWCCLVVVWWLFVGWCLVVVGVWLVCGVVWCCLVLFGGCCLVLFGVVWWLVFGGCLVVVWWLVFGGWCLVVWWLFVVWLFAGCLVVVVWLYICSATFVRKLLRMVIGMWEENKSENTGITSVDRSTKATLSTYNPWIQVSRLQKIYHFQHKKLIFTKLTLTLKLVHMQEGRDLMLVL